MMDYDPSTGDFCWRYCEERREAENTKFVGKKAGTINGAGYVQLSIDGIRYLGHRLAWLYIYGYIPVMIDHKDGIRNNNRLHNLRGTNSSYNIANSNLLHRGVDLVNKNLEKPYQARIKVNGVLLYLGMYNSREAAQAAYNVAATKYFGVHARCNRVRRI